MGRFCWRSKATESFPLRKAQWGWSVASFLGKTWQGTGHERHQGNRKRRRPLVTGLSLTPPMCRNTHIHTHTHSHTHSHALTHTFAYTLTGSHAQ